MAYDKNVYLLGAGASVESGAPVLKDFLKRARKLFDLPEPILDKDELRAFQNVFSFRSKMTRALRYIKCNLDNVEELFSLADMACQFSVQGAENTIEDLIVLISRTIDLEIECPVDKQRNTEKKVVSKIATDPAYTYFMNRLEARNKRRTVPQAELDCIITLNYDSAIDRTCKDLGIEFTYCHPKWKSGMGDQGYKLIKLHGSVNWGICPKCDFRKAEMNFFGPDPDKRIDERVPDPKLNSQAIEGGLITMNTSKILSETQCPDCQQTNLRPFIVPPTWNKSVYRTGLNTVWAAAHRELTQATHLIIVGYSLPETDTFFKYMLASALSENESLQRITVIDPAYGDDAASLSKRYRNFIAPHFESESFDILPSIFSKGIQALNVS